MNTSKIFFITLLSLILASCHDDIEDDRQVTSGPEFIPTVISEVETDIIGYVYDEGENPVADVLISLHVGSDVTTTSTNEYGIFRFETQALDGLGTYIKAQKDGFILGSDRLDPVSSTGTLYSYISLFSLNTNKTFVAADGGSVEVDGGGSITFDANSIVDEQGNAYDDRVVYTAKRIASDDPKLADRMPGGLYGLASDGSNVTLATLGMVAVELRDPSGNELNLAPGKTALVNFPIAEKDKSNAPSEVKLWSFDETNGLWIEEGMATRVGDAYEAAVEHFSFWNCDAPYPLVQVCGTVVYDNGEPATGIQVLVTTDGFGAGAGYTDSEGRFCGKMPKNAELTLSITSWACQNVLTTLTVGPFTSNTTIDPITIPTINPFVFEGSVLCDMDAEADALVVIQSGTYNFFTTTDQNGDFSITVNDQLCDNEAEFSIFAISQSTMEASEIINLDNGSQSGLVLQVCADCSFDADLLNAPNPCNKEEGILSVNVINGLNNFSFEWSNGNTSSSITYEVPGIYRVTVTDETGECEKILAATIEPDSFRFMLFADVFVQDCNGNLSTISLNPVNATPPVLYTWGGDITINDTDNPVLSDLAPGSYSVTATDANGCEAYGSYTTSNTSAFSIELFTGAQCDPQVSAEIFGGTPPFVYEWSLDGVVISTERVIFRDISGDYCVTVTDANGCTADVCQFLDEVSPVFFDAGYTCVDSGMIYNALDPGFEYIFEFGNGQFQSVVGGSNFFFDPIQYGYNFWVTVQDFNLQCAETFSVQLPQFDSLIITTVANGTIEADLSGGFCSGCVPIGPFIYAEGNLSVDLSGNNGSLAPGKYIVAVRDEQTECLVGHEEVELQ